MNRPLVERRTRERETLPFPFLATFFPKQRACSQAIASEAPSWDPLPQPRKAPWGGGCHFTLNAFFLISTPSLVFLLITSFANWESSSSPPQGGGTQKSFIQGGSVSPKFDSLPFYIPFFTEKVSLSCTVS